jgi:PAS domain S-box-containing protein
VITVLLVTRDERWRGRITAALPDASVFLASTEAEALAQLGRIDIDLVVWVNGSLRPGGLSLLDRVRELMPTTVTVAMGADENGDLPADFALAETCTTHQLRTVLAQAVERHRLLDENAALRARVPVTPVAQELPGETPAPSTRVLKEFTRILAAGFDLSRTLEMFVEAVFEFLRPARLAVLLPEADKLAYRVRVHRGVAPQIVDAVRLSADRGLCHWLTVQGRPARAGDVLEPQVRRELALLQAVLAVPLLARGELVAVLVVGPPVVHSGYAAHEVETLFDLATHLAGAIDGITLHHRLQRSSEFNERILQHMSTGVVTIGVDERVATMNPRAAEILGLDPAAIVGQDLRALPSPLGDMLYEALISGRAQPRAEIRLALGGLWLEVSTYPVRSDETMGAVLVLDDLTAEKELAAQKREADQLDLLTRVIARIADEIKNPLVSINTFMELIGERFDDPDFRRHFSTVVAGDVRRLVQVFEKLAGLVSQGELNFHTVDVHTVIEEAVADVERGDGVTRKTIAVHVTREPAALAVKVEPTQLRKAFTYLIWYLGHHSPDPAAVSVSVARRPDSVGPDDVRIVVGSRTAVVPVREGDRLFDPLRMVQENLIDIGPAVSQRIVEALGGRLELRHGRHDVAFVMRLPVAV